MLAFGGKKCEIKTENCVIKKVEIMRKKIKIVTYK